MRKLNNFEDYSKVTLTDLKLEEFKKRYQRAVDLIYPSIEVKTKKYIEGREATFNRNNKIVKEFPNGSLVMVTNQGKNLKLDPSRIGPFIVRRRNTSGSYELQTRSGVSLDRPFPACHLTSALDNPFDDSLSAESYFVDKIVGHIWDANKETYIYKVRWVGYEAKDDTYEPIEAFADPSIVTDYHVSAGLHVKVGVKRQNLSVTLDTKRVRSSWEGDM